MLDTRDKCWLNDAKAELFLYHMSKHTIFWAMFSQIVFISSIKTQKRFTARLIRSFYEVCVLLLTQAFIRITFFKREEG